MSLFDTLVVQEYIQPPAQTCPNPNGIASSSPGLARSCGTTLGARPYGIPQPCKRLNPLLFIPEDTAPNKSNAMKSMPHSLASRWMLMAPVLLMVARLQAAEPVKVVSPADFKDIEGDRQSGAYSITDTRFQQFYLATDFIGPLPNGGYIKEIRFRTDKVGGSLASVLSAIEVNLSYGPGFGSISTTFEQNKGAQYTRVYSGDLSIPATASGQFDMAVILQTPFLYDPKAGNLMMDFIKVGPLGFNLVPLLDYTLKPSHTAILIGNRLNSSGNSGAGGYITQFTIDAVPEPASVSLMLMGGVIFWSFRRKTR